jgi:hypothetical protein
LNGASVSGGGAYFSGGNNNTIEDSLFQGNSASGYGGGAYFSGGNNNTIENSIFRGNSATATDGTSANANAYGGGAYIGYSTGTITDSCFEGNEVRATGGSASSSSSTATAYASASGGGAYFGAAGTITGSRFEGNEVRATGGTSAFGGSSGTYTWANADAYAFGGGAYFHGGAMTITDSSFIGNSVGAEAAGTVYQSGTEHAAGPEAYARGGALFVNTNAAAAALTLKADAEDVVISGNTASDAGNGRPDGIHFGRAGELISSTGYFAESKAGTEFDVIAENRNILMADPVTAELYNAAGTADFAMTVQAGAGTFTWGGTNVLDANGGATVAFENGSRTVFLNDFTLKTTPNIAYRAGSATDAYATATSQNTNALKVTLSGGADVTFFSTRDPNLALFDFTGSTSKNQAGNFEVEPGATMNMAYPDRQLLSVPAVRYLVADGVDDSDSAGAVDNLKAGSHISGFEIESFEDGSNQVWTASTGYDSPRQPEIDEWENLENAAPSLEELLCDGCAVTDEQFEAVAANLASATPDHVLNQAVASLQTSGFVLDSAREFAFAPDSLRAGGIRLWGGYAGMVGRIGSHERRRGYRQNVNGFLTGATYDFASAGAGLFVGYTRGDARTRSGSTGAVGSDGYHAGLLGRISPLREMPGFSLAGEAGFSYYDNAARRDAGAGGIGADFAQRVYSLGAGAEYAFELGGALLTPFARLRYSHLDQDQAEERGGLTRARVGGLSGNGLSSELGASVSRTGVFSSGRVSALRVAATPYALASWRHEFGDTAFSTGARYGLPEGNCLGSIPSFRMVSVRRDRDAAVLGAGFRASADLAGGRFLGASAGYRAAIGRKSASHVFSVLLELAF